MDSITSQANSEPITSLGLSLFVILFGSFVAPILMHSSTVAIPAIAQELGLTAQAVSWFTFIQVMGNAGLVLPAGKLADIYGRKKIFCSGLLLAAIACVIGATAQNELAILITRFLQGAGAAFIWGSSIALVSSIPPEDKKAQVMSIYIAVCYVGVVVGPLFGGYVIKYFDWRWIFGIPAALLLVTALIGYQLKWERYGDRTSRLRVLDTSLYLIALSMIAMAVFRSTGTTAPLLLSCGLVSFAAFFWFQTKRRDPLLQVKLFLNNRLFAVISIARFLAYSVILSLPFTVTLYLQYIKAVDAQTAGWILMAQALFTAIITPLNSSLVKGVGLKRVLLISMFCLGVAVFVLAKLDESSPLSHTVFALSLVGIAMGFIDTQLLHIAMQSVEQKLLGSAAATMNGMRTMGGFLGLGLISFLINRHVGEKAIVAELYPDLLQAIHEFYLTSCMLMVISFGLLIWGVIGHDKKADVKPS